MESSPPIPRTTAAVCLLFLAWTVAATVYWKLTDDTLASAALLVTAQLVGYLAFDRSVLRGELDRLPRRAQLGTVGLTLGVSLPAIAVIAVAF